MQVYRARNPKQSPLWQCASRHYEEFEEVYPERYQPRYGFLRPIIPEVIHKFLDCGNLERGFARIRCDHCAQEVERWVRGGGEHVTVEGPAELRRRMAEMGEADVRKYS